MKGRIAPRTTPLHWILIGLSTSENYTQNCTLAACFCKTIVVNRRLLLNAHVDLLTNYTCTLSRSRAFHRCIVRTTTMLSYGTDSPRMCPLLWGICNPI